MQVVAGYATSARIDDCDLDHVFEFADVSGKGVLLQSKDRILGETADWKTIPGTEDLQKVLS